ncbi:MAG: cysteine hydrolase [Patescibacteria group bacterium]
MKPALIIIDLQEDFFKDKFLAKKRKKISNSVNKLVKIVRSKKIPIIWVKQEYENDLSDAPLYNRKNKKKITIKNTKGCQFLSELDYNEKDFLIIKKRFSAFFKTDLEKLLKKIKIDTLIIAGINTMSCVRTTAIDAYQRDYDVILDLDATTAYDTKQHKNSIEYLKHAVAKIMDTKEIISLLK